MMPNTTGWTIPEIVATAAAGAFCTHEGLFVAEAFRANLRPTTAIMYAVEPTSEKSVDNVLEAAFHASSREDETDDYEGDAARRQVVDGERFVEAARGFGVRFAMGL